jgi:hypothetical protein
VDDLQDEGHHTIKGNFSFDSGPQRSREKVFRAPPVEWIADRISKLRDVLEKRTAQLA